MRTAVCFVLLLSAACRSADSARPFLVALSVPDADRSVQWYRDNLGFTLVSRNEFPDYGMTIAIVVQGDFRLELVQVRDSVAPAAVVPGYANPASLHGYGKIAFEVDDIDAWITRLRDRGVKFQIEPMISPTDNLKTFIVLDGDGNWIQFKQRVG